MLSEWQAPLHAVNTGRQEWQSWALSSVVSKLCQAAVQSSSLTPCLTQGPQRPSQSPSALVIGCLESALEERYLCCEEQTGVYAFTGEATLETLETL